jgi:hypothetical protein
MMNYLV